MKYILNEIPVKTTNGFNINNLSIDLELPTNIEYKKYICNNDKIDIKYSKINNMTSKIGIDYSEALNIDITINDKIDDNIYLKYQFDNNDNLVNNININFKENSKANIIFIYESLNDILHFHYLKQNINVCKNADANITIFNMLNDNSMNFVAIESNVDSLANLNTNIIDLGGNIRVYNAYSNTLENAKSILNNLYIGKKENIIDMNYCYVNNGKKSFNNIICEGALSDNAKKNFRGTIDFKKGFNESEGHESEDCILLSDSCVSRSVPLLLCGEEDVNGTHSVSSGKIDNEKIFYLMSRGMSEDEALKFIVKSKFNKILNNIDDEDIVNTINKIIEKII